MIVFGPECTLDAMKEQDASRQSMSLLSVPDAARRCSVSPFTLRRWLRLRRLPHVRLGRRVLLAEADLAEFISAHRVEAQG